MYLFINDYYDNSLKRLDFKMSEKVKISIKIFTSSEFSHWRIKKPRMPDMF